jgi:hypothetical protein
MNAIVIVCSFLSSCLLVHSEDILHMRVEEDPAEDDKPTPDQAAFRHVVPLNSVTFAGNVIKSKYVKHWIVLYCVPWFQQCEELYNSFNELASKEHRARNDKYTMLSSEVRFAHVDCAKNKPLCNAMEIDTYPVVMHYHDDRQSKWSGGYAISAKSRQKKMPLAEWVAMRLDEPSAAKVTLNPLQAWQGLDEDTKNLLGGLVCVGVLVYSLTKCMDQMTQLAKLQMEATKNLNQEGIPADPTAAFFPNASTVSVQPGVESSQVESKKGQLIDLDSMVEAAQPPAAPGCFEL